VGFINAELARLQPPLGVIEDYSTVFDTLSYARKKHAGQRNSLDALCKRYNVDNSHRDLHGALLDAEILADVFLLMTGAQSSLLDEDNAQNTTADANQNNKRIFTNRPALAIIPCTESEQQAHQQRLETIEKASGLCLWQSNTN
jgi:DNA polymerase-3 subunit epsilon